jgi:hypothetical protein
MTTRRLIPLISGGLAAVLAAAVLTAGGLVLWQDGKKDADGYLTTATHTFTSPGHAIATDDLDIDEDGPADLIGEDVYGHVRLKVQPHGDKPVFVGIAPTADVGRYLSRSSYSEVTDVSFGPFEADYRPHGGSRRPSVPAAQGFWTASAHGAGPQTLDWKVRSGGWSVVVMNADGSPAVDAGVSVGATLPALTPLGWGLIGGGLLIAVIAVGLIVVGVRAPSRSARAHQPVTA